MMYSSRLLGLLELELSKQLQFSFTVSSNSAPFRPTSLRRQDVLEVEVSVRNDSPFPFHSLHGSVAATRWSRFRPLNFRIPTLEPGKSYSLGRLALVVLEIPNAVEERVIDGLATVSVSAVADLSNVVFQEWERPLLFAQSPGIALSPESSKGPEPKRVALRTQGTAWPVGLTPIHLSES
jgi:hypothetical protein